jgi:hypothetical protein
VGRDVLPETVSFSEDLQNLFGALDDLGENPNTLLAIRDLTQTVRAGRPLLDFAVPYQTVCNYPIYFINALGEHLSEETGGGTLQRIQLKVADREQPNDLTERSAARPVDTEDSKQPGNNPPAALHTQASSPAVDPEGNADCQPGQFGYPRRLVQNGRYGPNELGGQSVVQDADTPGRRGGTYKARQLGIDSIEDVP